LHTGLNAKTLFDLLEFTALKNWNRGAVNHPEQCSILREEPI